MRLGSDDAATCNLNVCHGILYLMHAMRLFKARLNVPDLIGFG